MYFSESDVRSVMKNLAGRFPQSEILFDVVNVWMSKNSHIHDSVKLTNAQFIYGTDDNRAMENWADASL